MMDIRVNFQSGGMDYRIRLMLLFNGTIIRIFLEMVFIIGKVSKGKGLYFG